MEVYEGHLARKTRKMHSLLKEAGWEDFCPDINPTPQDKGFRTRVKLQIFPSASGIGIRGKDPLAGDVGYKQMLWILPVWARDRVEEICCILDEHSPRFRIDGVELRLAHGREKAHITLSIKRQESGLLAPLAHELLEQIPDLIGVAVPSARQVFGDEFLMHRIMGKDIAAHYTAFFQANLFQLPVMLHHIKSSLVCVKPGFVLDLYCGVGLLSLLLGGKKDQIIGIDLNRGAIASAQKNAADLGFFQAKFFCSSVEKFLALEAQSRPDWIFINPSRLGCGAKVVASAAALGAETVCSVSCSFPSHMRDLLLWRRYGYRLLSLAAFDMFPFTDFLETVAVLEKET